MAPHYKEDWIQILYHDSFLSTHSHLPTLSSCPLDSNHTSYSCYFSKYLIFYLPSSLFGTNASSWKHLLHLAGFSPGTQHKHCICREAFPEDSNFLTSNPLSGVKPHCLFVNSTALTESWRDCIFKNSISPLDCKFSRSVSHLPYCCKEPDTAQYLVDSVVSAQ